MPCLSNSRAVCWGDDSARPARQRPGDVDSAIPAVVRNGADTGPLSGSTEISAGASFTCARLTKRPGALLGADDQTASSATAGRRLLRASSSPCRGLVTGEGVLDGITQLTHGHARTPVPA